jgi:hypothetical protein
VRGIQSRVGDQPQRGSSEISQPASSTSALPPESISLAGSDDFGTDLDDASSVSDVLAAEQPSHLRLLFQNDWLTVDSHQENEQLRDRKAKADAPLLDVARRKLQRLIPPREELAQIARSGSYWLAMLHTLLPPPFSVQPEFLENYYYMCQPGVDVISLASWLLDIAIIARQSPHEQQGGPSIPQQNTSAFCRALSDTVEHMILAHDRLIGSVRGLSMAMRFLRL